MQFTRLKTQIAQLHSKLVNHRNETRRYRTQLLEKASRLYVVRDLGKPIELSRSFKIGHVGPILSENIVFVPETRIRVKR